MAGAGKRTFIAGEVLTAAQVNDYLMDQAVMRFSGSAARAASITAPTEGMVTYLDDQNRLEFYDGSAWVVTDLRRFITASAQVLVGATAGSVIAVGGAVEGQVLTAASTAPGGVTWVTPSGAGAGAWANVTASGSFIGMTQPLEPGFYKITTNSSLSYTSAEFRFATTGSVLYGASLTNGAGFFSMPVETASINVTKGAPMTVLIEEIPSLTTAIPVGPSITGLAIPTFTSASFTASAAPQSTGIGFWQLNTGSFNSLAASATSASFISALSASPTSLGDVQNLVFVQRAANGLWGTGTTASVRWPFQVFNANGTYTPPSWSTAVDVVVVAGGGGGGISGFAGGGGAGGASLWTNFATPASVSVTIGGGGAAGTSTAVAGSNGSNSLFGSASVVGGGGGGGSAGLNGANGGSGGGAGSTGSGTAGTGTSGQGNPGSIGTGAGNNRAGSGGGHAAAGTADNGGDGTVFFGIPLAGGGGGGGDNRPGGLGGGGQGGPAFAPGTANTGGGGGGGGQPGGSGVVIVRARS